MVCLFVNNDYGIWASSYWNGNNNINGTTTDSTAINSNPGSTTLALQMAYVHKILDTLATEPNVLYEVANEPAPTGDLSVSFAWQESIVSDIHSYESGHAYSLHPVAVELNNSQLGSTSADFVAPYEFQADPPVYSLGKPVVADTDHYFGFGGGTDWWWRAFMNGNNMISMDDMTGTGLSGNLNLGGNAALPQNRQAVHDTRTLTTMVDMTAMVPHGELSSSGYELADTVGHKYMAYAGGAGSVTINLSSASGVPLKAFWLSTANGSLSSTTNLTGGSSSQSFTSPFGGTPATLVITP